ncbi:OmpA family protein [Rhodobacteraceae bacterium CCMM004]|nr:OmpA family protein [Rhodobacteraceae bacterium CCMM004]
MTMRALCLSLAALAAAGCTQETNYFTSFDQPAGAFLDSGNFGNPTMNNMLVQTGQISPLTGLNNRFSTEVESTVTFAFDSAVLDATARTILARQAHWIRQFPEVAFRVYGHTDLVGSEAYNKRLGLRRAHAVVNFLVAHGVSRSRLQAVVSFGETQPLIVTQGRARANRRTVTEVSGFVGAGSGRVLNGKYAEVIFREYVESATELPVSEQDGLAEIAAAADG